MQYLFDEYKLQWKLQYFKLSNNIFNFMHAVNCYKYANTMLCP